MTPLSRLGGAVAALSRDGIGLGERLAIERTQRVLDRSRVSALGPLRRHRPVLRVGRSLVVVSRREDVLAILADHEGFDTPYARRLPGEFVLGLDGDEYERHLGALRRAVREDDLPRLRERVTSLVTAGRTGAREPGRLDVGADLVHPAHTGVVSDYLGLAIGGTGPDARTLAAWARDMFAAIFLNEPGFASVERRGDAAARRFETYVDSLVAARRREPARDDVLGRLTAQRTLSPAEGPVAGLDDVEVRNNLIGLAIGWLWHGTRAALVAVDELLDRPDALALAREAARTGDAPGLQRVLWEALRCRPVQVGVVRVCRRETTLAAGTPHQAHLVPGDRVLVGTHSAMWDEDAVPDPGSFDPLRADGQYLIFGHGRHRCLGEHLMKDQLPAMLGPLLARDGLARAPGRAGRLRWAGGCPDGLRVQVGKQPTVGG